MPETTKEEFLKRIAAQYKRPPLSVTPGPYQRGVPSFYREKIASLKEMEELFITGMRDLGGEAVKIRSAEDMRNQLQDLIRSLKIQKAVRWSHPELDALPIDDLFQEEQIPIMRWGEVRDRDALVREVEKCDLGITWADYAIANTATLALLSTPNQGRLVSLMPPIHVAIFRKSQLVWRMGEIFSDIAGRAEGRDLPSSINLITGPSRTSDIENDLAIGVHGPGKVYAFILD